jgi:hypothetical protein
MNKWTQVVCTACGAVGYPKKIIAGSPILEILLWLFFLLPGLIYTLWRHANQNLVCRTCGQGTVIPRDTPMGRNISSDLVTKHGAADEAFYGTIAAIELQDMDKNNKKHGKLLAEREALFARMNELAEAGLDRAVGLSGAPAHKRLKRDMADWETRARKSGWR